MSEVISPFKNAHIDFKVLLVFVFGIILIQSYVEFVEESEFIVVLMPLISTSAVAVLALSVSRRYWKSKVFGRSYLLLAIAYFAVFAGELTYNAYVFVFDADPYPSIADVFFFMIYPMSMGHLLLNIRSFRTNFTTFDKTYVSLIIISIVTIFAYFSHYFTEYSFFDFSYGLIFVGGAAAITGFATYGLVVTRKLPLGRAWVLLVAGIMFGTIGDVWYHYLELFEGYELAGIVNVFWYLSYWFIFYALYKHKKII